MNIQHPATAAVHDGEFVVVLLHHVPAALRVAALALLDADAFLCRRLLEFDTQTAADVDDDTAINGTTAHFLRLADADNRPNRQ